MYLSTISFVTLSPTVRAKYPSSHISPFHRRSFRWLCANRSFRYFGHHTRWYNTSYTECLVFRIVMLALYQQAPGMIRGTVPFPLYPLHSGMLSSPPQGARYSAKTFINSESQVQHDKKRQLKGCADRLFDRYAPAGPCARLRAVLV